MFISTNDRDMDMGIDRAMDMDIYMNMVMDLHTDTDIGKDLELTWMDIQPKTKSVESVKIYKSKVSIRIHSTEPEKFFLKQRCQS